jgi:hypothetical protein
MRSEKLWEGGCFGSNGVFPAIIVIAVTLIAERLPTEDRLLA